MNSSKTMIVIRKGYDNLECALWAALLSFVIYFGVCIAPNLPEMARRAEGVRVSMAAEENRAYCEKWEMTPGARDHALCTMDLRDLRRRIEQELADRASIF